MRRDQIMDLLEDNEQQTARMTSLLKEAKYWLKDVKELRASGNQTEARESFLNASHMVLEYKLILARVVATANLVLIVARRCRD